MKVRLLNGSTVVVPTDTQKSIMNGVCLNIIDILNDIYSRDEISDIFLNLRGEPTECLLIRIILNFTESDDVIEVGKSRFYNSATSRCRLTFIHIHKHQLIHQYSSNSEIAFWYNFTEEEYNEWNKSPDEFFTIN